MDYYRTYLKPFLKEICQRHLEFSTPKESPDVSSLDIDVKNKFIGLMMDYTEEYFVDVELEDMVYSNLRILLKTNNIEDKEILADSIVAAFYSKYKGKMQKLLDEEYECELMEKEQDTLLEAGYCSKTDQQTGENYYAAAGKSDIYLG